MLYSKFENITQFKQITSYLHMQIETTNGEYNRKWKEQLR